MKRIITISREFGAGGGEIGKALAKKLNYEYYDKEIILQAARLANMDVESIIKWDEKVPINFGFAQSLFDFYNKPLNEKLFEIQQVVIRQIGEKGRCVIVGRNANTILKEFDSCLHVFLHGDPHWRMERMKGRMSDTPESKISEKIRLIDKARRKYCFYYTNTEFGFADYYDVSLSTSSLGIETCTDILWRLAGEKTSDGQ